MRLPVVALVVLALTAGCGGLTGPAAEQTVTPAPVPEQTAQPDTASAIAPGVGGGRVIDADRIARAHRTAIQNQSYRWWDRQRATKFSGNGTMTVTSELRVEHERRYQYDLSTSWTFANTSEYTAGTVRYRREIGRAGYRYEMEDSTPVTARFGDRAVIAIQRYLSIGNASVATTQVDGQRYYRVTGTTESIPVTGEVSNYTVRALIAPSGFVRTLSVSYDDVIGTNHEEISYQYRYSDVGETRVDPPEWVNEQWPEVTITPTDWS